VAVDQRHLNAKVSVAKIAAEAENDRQESARILKYKLLSKDEGGETGAVAVDQKHLNAKVSIAKIATQVENDRQESARRPTQAHGTSTETIPANLHKIWSSPRDRPGGCPFCQTRICRRSV
jgi:hypothetical protein